MVHHSETNNRLTFRHARSLPQDSTLSTSQALIREMASSTSFSADAALLLPC